ncbi:CBS domain-containing protein [Luteolibacter arcticus]|uniref:CBS domain-containing protein n=1 Tax=Luteolibacter arcticus TaxID=1581411 RepID=A0ABT3GQ93_9BACT|nr:CBS domain-containing protein [Luteolibacter arcticus]MCW1925646.1 CBS domain-containing protein [Luteolibacter arcticus]
MENPLSDVLRHKGSRVSHVAPECTVQEAVRQMNSERVGALLVMCDDIIVGIFTERDLLRRVVAEDRSPAATRVGDVMTSEVVVVKPNRTVGEAMQVVTEKRVRHLPVVEDGRLLGIISSGDLTRWTVAEKEGLIHSLMDYIQGTYPA